MIRGTSPAVTKLIAWLLLLLGVQLWLVLGHGMWGRNSSLQIVAVALLVALIPPINRLLSGAIDRLRHPPALVRRLLTVTIAVASTVFFVATKRQQGLDDVLRIHDESSYLIQTRMVLHGRLWMPQHPLADFFESFHVIVKPVYASKYFPGTALLYAPGLGLGLPYWLLPALAAGGVVALTYSVITRLTDNIGGILATLMMLANGPLRRAATLYLSAAPLLLLGLLAVWALLHWRAASARTARAGWAAALGLFLSWAAVTRPLDALCFAVPLGAAMLFRFRNAMTSLPWVFLGAAPLLLLQFIVNLGVTGNAFITPWSFYTQRDDPYDGMTLRPLPAGLAPQTKLPQKLEFSEGFTRPAAEDRRKPGRLARWFSSDLAFAMQVTLPHPLMLVLLPVGLVSLTWPRRGALGATLPLALGAYALYTFDVPQYLVITAPVGALAIVGAIEALNVVWPKRRVFLVAFMVPAVAGLSLVRWPQFDRIVIDDSFRPNEPAQIAQAIASLPRTPAVVLFHFTPGKNNPHEEPVYNIDVAWPDDAPIIRAHDLGRRNIEIFRYYAQRQPQRAFYLYDRGNESLVYLGSATELARP